MTRLTELSGELAHLLDLALQMQQPAWDRNILGLWKAAMAGGGGAGLAWALTQIFPLLVETELRRGNSLQLDWSSTPESEVGPGQGWLQCLLSRCRDTNGISRQRVGCRGSQ